MPHCILSRVYNREREYPTVNMSPERNVTFDHSHVMHVHVHWSVCSFQACDSPKTYSIGMYGSSTLSFSIIYSWYYSIYATISTILHHYLPSALTSSYSAGLRRGGRAASEERHLPPRLRRISWGTLGRRSGLGGQGLLGSSGGAGGDPRLSGICWCWQFSWLVKGPSERLRRGREGGGYDTNLT